MLKFCELSILIYKCSDVIAGMCRTETIIALGMTETRCHFIAKNIFSMRILAG